jgi:hypothetical protein
LETFALGPCVFKSLGKLETFGCRQFRPDIKVGNFLRRCLALSVLTGDTSNRCSLDGMFGEQGIPVVEIAMHSPGLNRFPEGGARHLGQLQFSAPNKRYLKSSREKWLLLMRASAKGNASTSEAVDTIVSFRFHPAARPSSRTPDRTGGSVHLRSPPVHCLDRVRRVTDR